MHITYGASLDPLLDSSSHLGTAPSWLQTGHRDNQRKEYGISPQVVCGPLSAGSAVLVKLTLPQDSMTLSVECSARACTSGA